MPLFISFVEAGIPLGVVFAFLISSPMVNEIALVLKWGPFGPGIALVYMVAGLAVAIVGGLVIGKLHTERYVEEYVWALQGTGAASLETQLTPEDRVRDAWSYTNDLVRRILPYILVAIGIGAFLHGFVPTELVVAIGGPGNPLAVPFLVLLAIPLYSNAAGTIPILQALLGDGMAVGTTLAFMMAMTSPTNASEWTSCVPSLLHGEEAALLGLERMNATTTIPTTANAPIADMASKGRRRRGGSHRIVGSRSGDWSGPSDGTPYPLHGIVRRACSGRVGKQRLRRVSRSAGSVRDPAPGRVRTAGPGSR